MEKCKNIRNVQKKKEEEKVLHEDKRVNSWHKFHGIFSASIKRKVRNKIYCTELMKICSTGDQ